MGVIQTLFGSLFGGGSNVIAETAQVFRVNAENESQRGADYQSASLAQFGREFSHARKGAFDRFIDGLNRLPRPAMALGTIGLIVAAMVNPVWFADRMVGVALIPDPLWWLLGAIVSFYFGARHQATSQVFQASIAKTLAAGEVLRTSQIDDGPPETETTPLVADTQNDSGLIEATLKVKSDDNAALEDWKNDQR